MKENENERMSPDQGSGTHQRQGQTNDDRPN